MENTFTINGITYFAKAFDFNMLCDFDEYGISLDELGSKTMTTVRAYFSICSGLNKELAGAELQAHIVSGGSFEEIISAMLKEMECSDFFQAMANQNKSEVAPKKTTKK